jgi:transposase
LDLEHTMVSSLQMVPEIKRHLITQLQDDRIDKVTSSQLLGFRHRPDAAIGRNGTAIELKMVGTGQPLREAIGQAMAYRVGYRFVVLCLVDRTPERRLVNISADAADAGAHFLQALADEMGIFTVIAPRAQPGRGMRHCFDNVVFLPRRSGELANKDLQPTPASAMKRRRG